MKNFKLVVLAMALVVSMIPCSVSAASSPINVTIDGVAVQWTDALPYVDANNRTMVPLRPIGEAMGLDVEWDNSDKSATFSAAYDEKDAVSWGEVIDTDNDEKNDSFMGGSGVVFTLNEKMAVSIILFYKLGADLETAEPTYTDADIINMDTAAVMKDKRTYAPIKYLAEFYGYTVTWEQKTNTVVLTSETK
nr:copper amine oxidase N-terminal domain-containing protein [uncultured Aminipila sp.]